MVEDEEIKEINRKLDLLLSRIETLENLISTILGSQELARAISLLRISGELYRDYSDLSMRIAKAQRHLKKKEIASDDLMRCILRVLVVQGPRNISQITRAVRTIRGKASRSRIARKLRRMEEIGAIINIKEVSREKVYEIV